MAPQLAAAQLGRVVRVTLRARDSVSAVRSTPTLPRMVISKMGLNSDEIRSSPSGKRTRNYGKIHHL